MPIIYAAHGTRGLCGVDYGRGLTLVGCRVLGRGGAGVINNEELTRLRHLLTTKLRCWCFDGCFFCYAITTDATKLGFDQSMRPSGNDGRRPDCLCAEWTAARRREQ